MKASTYIPLPEFIMRKKAIINMENKDNKCFLWSVIRYLHPKEKHSSRLTDLRKHENDLKLKGIDFPVKLKDITKFENQNPDLPGINVFSVNEDNKIYPLRLNEKDCQKTIDLFLFSKDEQMHYTLIKNFSRLTRSQITLNTTRKLHICKKCLFHFTKQDLFEKHLRESNPEFHEFAVKTEISDFFISGQEKPFGDLFTKITIKLSKEFLFSRNSAKREMPYLLRSRHEILLRFDVFSKRSRRKTAQCTETIF